MRKLVVAVTVVAASAAIGCEVDIGSGSRTAKSPQGGAAPAATPVTKPAPAPTPAGPPGKPLGHSRGTVAATPSPGGTPAPSGTTPQPGAPGVMTGTNVFGSGTPDPNGWKGSYFQIPAGTSKMPSYATMTPTGFLFARELNVASTPMTGGFPGIDPTRNENFGIRWEAPLVVDTEGDYTFKLVSDDGAQLAIDDTMIVDNDGAHAAQTKTGPVHLVKGTHAIRVDYFQSVGSVALQLFCGKGTSADQICATHLL